MPAVADTRHTAGARLLVALAHPDDESFPMGGTVAKYVADGHKVTLVSATRGEAGIPGLSPTTAAQLREQELRTAAAELGVDDVRFLGWEDGRLAEVDPEQVLQQLTSLLHELRPDVVITFGPDGISGHPDHVAIHRLVTEAFDRVRLPARLYYIAPSEATQQGCGVTPPEEVVGGPVAGIDVGDHLVTKARAMQSHASQDPPYIGDPEEAAKHLTCHEYFALARPVFSDAELEDLFGELPDAQLDRQAGWRVKRLGERYEDERAAR